MTEIELLEHVLANRKAGRNAGDGLLLCGEASSAISVFGMGLYEGYAIAPRTHVVNDFPVPAPESTACNMGSLYYIPDASEKSWFMEVEWENYEADDRNLKRGLVHVEPRHAIANAKAMLGINPYSEGEK